MVIVANLAILLASYFLISEIASTSTNASLLQSKLEIKLEEQAKLDSMETAVNNASLQIAELEFHFVKKDGVVKFIEYVENLASKQAVRLKTNSVDTEKIEDKNPGFEKLNMKVEAIGKWKDIFVFLEMLELMPYKTVINTMQLSRASGNTEADFTVKTAKNKTTSDWRATVDFSVPKLIQ
jgi:hypothetical protein